MIYDERYSLCLAYRSEVTGYLKYFRIADYYPDDSEDELIPALVPEHTTSLEEARANPDHLYNPNAAKYHDDRSSDFYLFQWRLDENDPGKQKTRCHHDCASLLKYDEPFEVIILPGPGGEKELRKALQTGIPFAGKTTSRFYLAYEKRGREILSVRCERTDFVFKNGVMKLADSQANPRMSVISAPIVALSISEIIESPHKEPGQRFVYSKTSELVDEGRVLLRPLEYYAADYAKWFIREQGISVTKNERRSIAHIVESALDRPDMMEVYLEAGADQEETEKLKKAISDYVEGREDYAHDIVVKALIENDSIHERCVREIVETDEALATYRKQVEEEYERVESLRQTANDLKADVEKLRIAKLDAEESLEKALANLSATTDEADRVLVELEENAALRIGLRAASSSGGGSCGQTISLNEGGAPDRLAEATGHLPSVIAENLKSLGVTSMSEDPDDARLRLCTAALAAARHARVIAVADDRGLAVADALSIALDGKTADRAFVPSDFCNANELETVMSSSGRVIVLENILDAVNEALLFYLISKATGKIVFLPFFSYSSLSLVAKEAWEGMFLLGAECLVKVNSAKAREMFVYEDDIEEAPIGVDDILQVARDLRDEIEGARLPDTSLILPATIIACAEDLTDEDLEPLVSQHLAFVTAKTSGAEGCDAIVSWSPGDIGLAEMVAKAIENER